MEAWPVRNQTAKLFAAYPYRAGCENWCETVILSKTPLTDAKVSALGPVWRNRLITATTEIGGTKVNLVLAHMVKPYFDDLAASESLVLQKAIGDLEGPLLLAGDFNAAAWSENVARVARWRGLAPGPSYPATWPVVLGPLGVPIDNVFTRPPLVITDTRATDDALGSNHRGLISEIALAGAT
jgi:endonuclease/exonuclease/phosphatase (EEP) superfamily protein YafD